MTTLIQNHTTVTYLPVDRIATNPYQPRKYFDRAGLEDLVASIQEYGVMQPITVRIINGINYELVSGERRLRASRLAGFSEIPAIIINITDKDSAILALIENLQRQDLNYLEEAEGYANLIADHGFTQEELAQKIGKSQSTVANKLRILRLPKSVKRALAESDLTERHARALLKLESPHHNTEKTQLDILSIVTKKHLTVKNTEDLIDQTLLRLNSPSRHKPKRNIRTYIRNIRFFTNTIKKAVETMQNGGVDTIYDIEESPDGCFISIMLRYNRRPEALETTTTVNA